ncbi:hypothetical protein BDV93DRAFT_550361 [Ceratobasidium sp. AG-I]|nr:hypothetical protein BDV93DRAFT_550361 [Ceratobasidium sp. AG-I]
MTGDQAERTRKRAAREWDVMGDQETVPKSSGNNVGGRQGELRAVLAHHIEFEIALRNRVAKVVEERIQWAEELKEALVQGADTQGTSDPSQVKQRALEAFRAAHTPLDLDPHTSHPRGSLLSHLLPTTPLPPHISSPSPASTSTFIPTSKQLYIMSTPTPTNPFPPLLLLSCPYPTCPTPNPSTTLQGLLNHARIAHGASYAYASHDEFLRAEGAGEVVNVEEEPERYAGVKEGGVRVSVGGVRGLRGLFEAALGIGGENEEGRKKREGGLGLGLSVETPALAGLLGREVRKGEIRAVGQDEVVDVEEFEEGEDGAVGKEKWRGYGIWAPKRRGNVVDMDVVEDGVGGDGHLGVSLAVEDRVIPAPPPEGVQGSSRFHVKKRVVVSDWSQSLRRAQIQPDGPTHRWMIRLTAPSYSDHITTFLSAVRVQCASTPPLFDDTITCSGPPFAISRLARASFLARITLVFADGRTKDVVITQWVDLDPMRSGRPILGAEQIFDVELDRNARPLPADPSSDGLSNSVLWAEDRGWSDRIDQRGGATGQDALGVELVIQTKPEVMPELATSNEEEAPSNEDRVKPPHDRLIPILNKFRLRFPLTLEDAKHTSTLRTPYMLFETRSELLDATHGRRKAIEWQYTRTMLNILKTEYSSYDADLDQRLVDDFSAPQLYAYLVAEKVFPRPDLYIPEIKLEEHAESEVSAPLVKVLSDPARYCGSCGLDVLHHPPTPQLLDHSGFVCVALRSSQRPVCDIGLWTTLRPARDDIQHVNSLHGATTTQGTRAPLRGTSQLIERAVPQLTLAFHALTTSWALRTFDYSARRRNPAIIPSSSRPSGTRFSLELLGVDASHVDRTLAPHALLALVAEVFIKRLTRDALKAQAEMVGEPGPSVLTATHVSRALMSGRGAEGWLPLMAVAQIGMIQTDRA